ncbi:MAG: hypothetical protein JXI43_06785 [Tissierellales bacterium]|nr:hypothetical protein [Tissierellales bacterium]
MFFISVLSDAVPTADLNVSTEKLIHQLKIVRKIFQISACVALSLITGCSINESATKQPLSPKQNVHTNRPPEIAALQFSANNITVCDSIYFQCMARDPDNDSLTYKWHSCKVTDNSELKNYRIIQTEYNGIFIKKGSKTTWIPGALKGKYLIIVNVIDSAGYEVSALTIVNVEHKICDNILMVFEVSEIEGKSAEEYSKISKIVPSTITLSNWHDFEFAGKVHFYSLGWREINNFINGLAADKSFYIDFSDLYAPDGKIAFSNMQICNENLTGFWTLICSACDWPVLSITAIRK